LKSDVNIFALLRFNIQFNLLYMIKNAFVALYVVCAVAAAGIFSGNKPPETDPLPKLEPMAEHGKVSKEIVNAMRFYHYKEQVFDDSLSALIFDNFFKSLDGNRVYFLQEDLDKFMPHRLQLDDELKNGDVLFAFDVYNVYNQRVDERISYALSIADKPNDYTSDETFSFDRQKAPWFSSRTDLDGYWTKKIKYETLNLKLAGKEEKQTEETISKRYTNFRTQMQKQRSEDVFQLYMNALTEAVEPHTSYFSPRTAESFKITMSNSLEGIGATLRTEGEYTKIVETVKGGPADKSKQLHKDDRIVAVGQDEKGEMEDIIGWRIDDVVAKIRGAKGSLVRLEVLPADASPGGPTKIVRIIRDKVKLEEQSAKSEIINLKENGKAYKIGIIDLPSFYLDYEAMQRGEKDYKSTTGDVTKILKNFQKEGVDGVIMDLRSNGGGSLYEAVELTGLFIDNGPVVQVRDAQGTVEVKKDEPGVTYGGPFMVMTDRFSASASEIFAGAIQDYGRGLVVGNTTYGKGTVQNLLDINRLIPRETAKLGQIKMTIAKFYRITGSSTQHKGVTPDISFPEIYSAEDYGESAEKTALPWDKIGETSYSKVQDLSSSILILKNLHDERMNSSEDFKFMLQDIQDFNKRKEEKSVSLNEEKLKAERDEDKKEELDRYNKHRALKGLPPLAKMSDKPAEEKAYDFVKEESEKIMMDYINLAKSGKLVKK